MTRARNPTPEADMAALKSAADRARAALACAFSSSAEFEADLIRERRAKGAYRAAPRRRCVSASQSSPPCWWLPFCCFDHPFGLRAPNPLTVPGPHVTV
jgi:hypothetical protein